MLRKCGAPTGYVKHMSKHHVDGKAGSFKSGASATPQQVMSSTCLSTDNPKDSTQEDCVPGEGVKHTNYYFSVFYVHHIHLSPVEDFDLIGPPEYTGKTLHSIG